MLIFGGFLSRVNAEPDKEGHWRLKAALGAIFGVIVWITTWVLPLSFMIAMAWACKTNTRDLGLRTIGLYGGESAITELARRR